ncbi:MAG: Gfo/Idh/MocA family protein, partial [Rhodothermales bacterium]
MLRFAVLLAWMLLLPITTSAQTTDTTEATIRIGMIGLDTSHSPAFAKLFNSDDALDDFRVVAAYPYGSRTIESSYERIPRYTEEVQALGVEIVDSIDELIERVDVVLLETNDGRLHLEQALPVLEAGKPLFIDKPMAASLADVLALFDAADHYGVPVFSASSLRFQEPMLDVRGGSIGRVLGADAYSP